MSDRYQEEERQTGSPQWCSPPAAVECSEEMRERWVHTLR